MKQQWENIDYYYYTKKIKVEKTTFNEATKYRKD